MAVENGIILNLDRVEEIMRKTQELASTQVLVGIPAAKSPRQGDAPSNAALGYLHEMGSPARNIPARPWLGPPVNRMRDEAAAMLKKAAELRFDGKSAEADQVLHALGLTAQNKVKQNITSGGDPVFAPNAPSTVARKGSDRPLIDKAQVLNSVSYVLRKKGSST
jgi:hypothetical protein